MERAKHGHGHHGRAVGVGDDPLRAPVEILRVDLGDDQRDVGVHAPGRGVVDHRDAGGGEAGRLQPARWRRRPRTGRRRARRGRRWRRPPPRADAPPTRSGARPSGPRRTRGARSPGKPRSASTDRMTPPTRPVAPTTPTRMLEGYRASLPWKDSDMRRLVHAVDVDRPVAQVFDGVEPTRGVPGVHGRRGVGADPRRALQPLGHDHRAGAAGVRGRHHRVGPGDPHRLGEPGPAGAPGRGRLPAAPGRHRPASPSCSTGSRAACSTGSATGWGWSGASSPGTSTPSPPTSRPRPRSRSVS